MLNKIELFKTQLHDICQKTVNLVDVNIFTQEDGKRFSEVWRYSSSKIHLFHIH